MLFLDEPTAGLDPEAAHEVHDLIDGLREKGVTIFLTTHRLEEAEQLCDRVAIMNTTLRTIGRPDELRDRMFHKSIEVRTRIPLSDPAAVLDGLPGVERWRLDGSDIYLISVSDPTLAAPEITRALVRAGADLLSLVETRHSLEEVYLELMDEQVDRETK